MLTADKPQTRWSGVYHTCNLDTFDHFKHGRVLLEHEMCGISSIIKDHIRLPVFIVYALVDAPPKIFFRFPSPCEDWVSYKSVRLSENKTWCHVLDWGDQKDQTKLARHDYLMEYCRHKNRIFHGFSDARVFKSEESYDKAGWKKLSSFMNIRPIDLYLRLWILRPSHFMLSTALTGYQNLHPDIDGSK